MNVSIRRIKEGEYAEASALVLQVFREMVAASMSPEGIAVFEAFASPEQIKSRDAAGAVTYSARDKKRLVGVLQVRDGTHITLFFTLPAYQGKGVGRALVNVADQNNVLQTVNSSTIAVKSYERLGFRVSGEEQVKNGIRFVPMVRNAA